MERWAKKQAKNKEAARPLATAQATQDMVKESTYQYDPNDLKVCSTDSEVIGISQTLADTSAVIRYSIRPL